MSGKNSSSEMKRCVNSHSNEVFKDLHFVLTYSSVLRVPPGIDSDQTTDNESSSHEELFEPTVQIKNEIINKLRKHGGIVYDYVSEIPMDRYNCSYIITDVPSQTCNFILGLSVGIPAYHHKHIFQAAVEEKYFPDFLADENIQPIPNGWSIESGNMVFRSPATDHKNLFSGHIIYLALSNDDKSCFIASLLRYCGATVFTSWTNGVCSSLSHQVIIITDVNCPLILSRANVPKLSLFWLIQCLITESIRPVDGHICYYGLYDENV